MKITQSGLYTSADIKDSEVHFGDNLEVYFFDDATQIQEFILGENTKLFYFSAFMNEGEYKKHFKLVSASAELQVNSMIYAEDNTITSQIIWELAHSHTKENLQIVSFAGPNWVVDLDGVVQINEQVEKVEGYLKEENIFLGTTGKIRWIPTLLVRSNDVQASHACNIEKISDEKLFYLRSRGIEKNDATSMMILAYIEKTFSWLEKVDGELYERVMEEVIGKIQK